MTSPPTTQKNPPGLPTRDRPPALWHHLAPDRQRAVAQHLAALIGRRRSRPVGREGEADDRR